MAVSKVTGTTRAVSTGSAPTVPVSGTISVATRDLVIVNINYLATSLSVSSVASNGNGNATTSTFAKLGTPITNGNARTEVWYAFVTSGTTLSITVTFSTTLTNCTVTLEVYRGASLDTNNSITGSGGAGTDITGTYTTKYDGSWVGISCCAVTATALTAGTNTTAEQTVQSNVTGTANDLSSFIGANEAALSAGTTQVLHVTKPSAATHSYMMYEIVAGFGALDAPNTSESLSSTKQLLRTTTDAPHTSESVSAAVTGLHVATESLTMSESVVRIEQLLRATTDVPTISETISVIVPRHVGFITRMMPYALPGRNYGSFTHVAGGNVFATETITLSESVTKLFIGSRTVTDAPTISESTARIEQLLRVTADAPVISESISSIKQLLRATTDNPTASESLVRLFSGLRTTIDNPSISENLASVKTLFRVTTDSPSASESIVRILSEIRTTSDNLAISESLLRLFSGSRIITENPVISESLIGSKVFFRTINDAVEMIAFNPIAYWTFDDTIADITGHGYDLSGFAGFIGGLVGNAVQVTTPGSSTPSLSTSTIFTTYFPITIIGWIQISVGPSTSVYFAGIFDSSNQPVVALGIDNNGFLIFTDGDSFVHSTGTSVLDGNWHQVALTIDDTGSTARIYLDGQLLQGNSASPLGVANNFYVGYSALDNVTINVDELAIYPNALSAKAISLLYNGSSGHSYMTETMRQLTLLRTTSDNSTISESLTRLFSGTRTTADNPTISESLIGSKTLFRITIDSPTISESVVRLLAESRTTADSPTVSESLIRLFTGLRTTSDTITLSESVVGQKGLIIRTAADSITLSESVLHIFAGQRSLTDTPTTSESLIRIVQESRTTADNSIISESIARTLQATRTASDSPLLSEVLTRTFVGSRSIVDSPTMSETIIADKSTSRTAIETPTTSELIANQLSAVASATESLALTLTANRNVVLFRNLAEVPTISESLIAAASIYQIATDFITADETIDTLKNLHTNLQENLLIILTSQADIISVITIGIGIPTVVDFKFAQTELEVDFSSIQTIVDFGFTRTVTVVDF